MGTPIKVLQVMGIVESGGVEAVIMNYYRHIDKTEVQFDFVMHKGSNSDYIAEVKSMGAKVYEVTPYSNPIRFIQEVYSIIKKENYQMVHSNMNALSLFPLFAAYLAGVPVRILHNHSTDTKAEPLRTFVKHLLRPFARLFANEYWACSKLAGEWMYGKQAVADGKVTIINNAIDLKQFAFDEAKRNKLRKELGLQDGFVIGHVGRFMKQKNHDFLVDIFAEVAKKQGNAKLLLIGDGPLREQIENKVKTLGLDEKVIFTGVRSDVADLYNAMDVFVFPSLYEGLGMVAVEAQANGLPVISSTEVPKEAKISDAIKFEALSNTKSFWTKDILDCVNQRNIGSVDAEISHSEFDIRVEAKKLGKRYKKLAPMQYRRG